MNDKQTIGDILKSHGLRRTPIRTQILEVFMKNEFALSAGDLMAKMSTSQDRVTVYRALASFEEHGIVHKASEDGQGVRYALCHNSCPSEPHAETHAHFVCNECHHTYCLENVAVPKVAIKNGFTVDSASFTLSGVCKDCKH